MGIPSFAALAIVSVLAAAESATPDIYINQPPQLATYAELEVTGERIVGEYLQFQLVIRNVNESHTITLFQYRLKHFVCDDGANSFADCEETDDGSRFSFNSVEAIKPSGQHTMDVSLSWPIDTPAGKVTHLLIMPAQMAFDPPLKN